MNRYERYLQLSAALIEQYDGAMPFALYLKKYFAQNRQLGSRDRKQIAAACYAFFRTGHWLDHIPITESIPLAIFLCASDPEPMLEHISPGLHTNVHLSLEEKCSLAGLSWSDVNIFPWIGHLSDEIVTHEFVMSHLSQPNLFIRIRPGKKEVVEKKLQKAEIAYEWRSEDCIAVENGTDLTSVIDIDREAVVQDMSSQRIAECFRQMDYAADESLTVWDCCAASGGKSILCRDHFVHAVLTVTDTRRSVLQHLAGRFQRAGIKYEHCMAADLTKKLPPALAHKYFDLIIADVPCTGSGTWSRTPEWLRTFREDQIHEYVRLQQNILKQVIPQINEGGYLLYSTCSVFAAENEQQVENIAHQYGLEIISKNILSGYRQHADTLFGALLRKPR